MIHTYLTWIFLPILVLSQKLHTVDFLKLFGYPSETHYITTEDGYILTFHRIPHGINQTITNKPAVLIVHGMLSSSADYVNLGPKRSLGLILADMGYDVWLANSRGNSYSKNHTVLNPKINPKKFYKFSWHEMGVFDTPAAIDYILNLKEDKKLHYIGMSQGSTSFFAFASHRPDYNDKIKLASLMAPVAFMEQFSDIGVTEIIFGKTIDFVSNLKKDKIYNFAIAEILQNFIMNACGKMKAYDLCRTILSLVAGGYNLEQLDYFIVPFLGMNFPSEISLNQFEHYLQQLYNGGFKLFDYGAQKNIKKYGTPKPPNYNLSKITAPVALYIGTSDMMAKPPSVTKLLERLSNVVNFYEPSYQFFNHIDFILARDVKTMIFDEILRVMKMYD